MKRLIQKTSSFLCYSTLTNAIKHLSPAVPHLNDGLIAEKASGCWIFDTNGEKYLDFTCGIAVTNTGHCHPRVVKATQDQISKLIHGQVTIWCIKHS